MTSNPDADATLDNPRTRDASTSSSPPIERRTTSSSTKGYSVASSEAGESSTAAASKRNSLATLNDGASDTGNHGGLEVAKDGRGSHRSHRSRNSGAFLLSKSTFVPPSENYLTPDRAPVRQRSPREPKGKATVRSPEKKHTKRKSNDGLGIGSSPLGANVTSATSENIDRATESLDKTNDTAESKPPLDVDSAQIVSLALNLSESRRNAARRNVSSPLPPLASTFGEGFAGGSLRQHLQQQRRVSRNVSPKPQRASAASPRIIPGQSGSPLHTNFETHPDGAYQYHFTASTLARAEKAKTQLELMWQYYRLLECVPPLKPNTLQKHPTASSTISDGPSTPLTVSRTNSNVAATKRQIGRPYNPLQYIRNRKVRARERKAIDGEAQGFGDLDKVSSWVEQISKEVDNPEPDSVSIPVFSKEAELAASPHASPQPSMGKSVTAPVKVKRPRIDWELNPADMLADVFWLEQDGNKQVVEDRLGRKVFPQRNDMKRPTSKSEELAPQKTPDQKRPMSPDLRIDTKLPEFRSMKVDSDRYYDSTTSRVRHKIRHATRIHHGHNGSIREAQSFLRARSRSESDSSDIDGVRPRRRRRTGTAGSHDRGRDILEKQMLEMLAREAQESGLNTQSDTTAQQIVQNVETQKSTPNEGFVMSRTGGHSSAGSIAGIKNSHSKGNFMRNGSSGRASLEVPGGNPRASLEELDSTAPNSPQTQAAKFANAFVPSITMDLSPPQRQSSPSRNPLLRVKSKMNQFEHSRTRSRGRDDTSEIKNAIPSGLDELNKESPQTPEKRKRSTSPVKKVVSRKTDDSTKSSRGSLRKGKAGDESSGIRGLFKGTRGPVARVSDFIWKKDPPVAATSSGFSTDDSDIEEVRGRQGAREKGSRDSSVGLPDNLDDFPLQGDKPSYLSHMPTFTSPFQPRGRSSKNQVEEPTGTDSYDQRQAREERRKTSRANLLEAPPRIDIHNASPASSPDLKPVDSHKGSSISDIDSRRGSSTSGVQSADARLNYILGMPGQRRPSALYNGESSRGGRPVLEGKRQWSISDRGVSTNRGPMTKREIARVRTLLLSSGIKAKEISRRAAASQDLHSTKVSLYTEIVKLAREKVKPVPKCQEHKLAARILSDDIQLSKEVWKSSADIFCNTTIQDLVGKIEGLQSRIVENLTPMARKAADEADDVSKDLVTSQTLKVKRITDTMDKMLRKRRRRFRWLRRGGWVMVEWALVGVMWLVWFLVVFVRIVMGIGRGLVGATRWLLWL